MAKCKALTGSAVKWLKQLVADKLDVQCRSACNLRLHAIDAPRRLCCNKQEISASYACRLSRYKPYCRTATSYSLLLMAHIRHRLFSPSLYRTTVCQRSIRTDSTMFTLNLITATRSSSVFRSLK